MKLEIIIDLDAKCQPTIEELDQSGYAYALDYWLDLLYADPPLMLDDAIVRLTSVPADRLDAPPRSESDDTAAAEPNR